MSLYTLVRHVSMEWSLTGMYLFLPPQRPFMMPNLIPPKIPDGEKVDFDVSDPSAIKPKFTCL